MPQQQLSIYEAIISEARAHRNIRDRIAKELEVHGLTVMEWVILGLVYHREKKGVTITDLANILNVKIALTSVMISKQADAGWLEKVSSEQDSRLKYIYLTDKGRGLIDITEKSFVQALKNWISDIEMDDIQIYLKVITQLAKTAPA